MPRDHVLILPGGGYGHLSDRNRAFTPPWLDGLGLANTVVDYPVADTHPTPLGDGPLRAVRAAIRERRAAGDERVAVIGFSAGGHLAGLAAYGPGAADDERPDLAILAYPVVSMLLPTHLASRVNLLGEDADEARRASASLERLVGPDAPPTFVWHTAEDVAVPVQHSYLLGTALAEAGVRHALHVFPRGEHGLNVGQGSGGVERWSEICEDWLRQEGWIA